MIPKDSFIRLALSFPNSEQVPHFERLGFKATGRRMFCTYLEKDNTTNVFLTPAEQKIFCEIDSKNIFPVPNKWGEKGATTFNLDSLEKEIVSEALVSAYNDTLKKKAS